MTNIIIDENSQSIKKTKLEQSMQHQQQLELNGNNKSMSNRKRSSIVAATQIRQRQQQQEEQELYHQQRQTQNNKYNHYSNNDNDLLLKFPSIILAGLLNLMLAIPFGVSYFPIEWGSGDGSSDSDEEHEFPLPGKESLGIRMFMFSTFISQVIFTFTSSFPNAIGMQMVENVPFCHTLAYICISEQGYTKSSLSTLFFLFGLASVLVGIVFYILGYYQLGNIVYFFPSHVLIGCIGGIGIFVMKVGIEVSMNTEFQLTLDCLRDIVWYT